MNRRAFLVSAGVVVAATAGSAALIGLTRKSGRRIVGGFADDGSTAGHAIRDGARMPATKRTMRTPVVIVGGGVAGLSAAWWFRRHGFDDFVLLELGSTVGGNARGGTNDVSAFPWGAHYVPLPGPRLEYARTLFAEMGLFANGEWSERDLCHAPRERTFVHGHWREGQEEAVAIGTTDRDELRRFADETAELRASGGFTLPLAEGARPDSAFDRLTATQWLTEHGYRGRAVRWLVDYACRDDFGTSARDASAWAALHYFAARDGEHDAPLTWPEGNARIVHHLERAVGARISTGSAVHRVERSTRGVRVLSGDVAYECDRVVWAAPTFIASHVVEGAPPLPFTYAPWLVSNLTLDRWPQDAGAPARKLGDPSLAVWDNVIADSPSLGYVVATHQSLRLVHERTVWTHYWALAGADPRAERRRLMSATWEQCAEWVLADLERAHPDIRDCVSRIDVMRYGHAMPRPVPGFLAMRKELWSPATDARVLYANSDVSGLSLFEEAQYRGVMAATRVLAALSGS